ncbi:MAG: hypothetical protein COT16_03130 [Elusimicrobia bacterium CG08_land_8_20_14_0_20_44_26]|nr:MAG: hypothetical protein COT16_03130 [Elusimicrobia bacterium CG08_land_8_20_14_0_20_44_26]
MNKHSVHPNTIRGILCVSGVSLFFLVPAASRSFILGTVCALVLFSLSPGGLNTLIKCAVATSLAAVFLISGDRILTMCVPILFFLILPDFKILSEKRALFGDFKVKYDELLKKLLEFEKKNNEMAQHIEKLKSEIEKYEKLYELSKDIESISDGRELANKSLDAFSLKLGIEKLAFFRVMASGMELFSSKNLRADEIDDWKRMLGNIKNIPGGNRYEFPLVAGKKKLGAILVAGALDEKQINKAVVISSQVALGYEKTVLYEQVRELSRIDGLTGLFLRKYFMSRLEEEITRARRYDYEIAFLMCDLDDFKKYNDTYGHPMGDNVLAQAAKAIRDTINPSDFAGRYGGEEFCIYMPMAARIQTREKAEKIREEVKRDTSVSISIGIAYFPTDGSTAHDLIKASDATLYKAKKNGKNIVGEYA